jgi:hypothetical protein
MEGAASLFVRGMRAPSVAPVVSPGPLPWPLAVGGAGGVVAFWGAWGAERGFADGQGVTGVFYYLPQGCRKNAGAFRAGLYPGGDGHLRVFRGMQKGQGISVPGLLHL